MLSARPSRRKSSAIGFRRAGYPEQMRAFSSAEYCFRVARLMSRTSFSDVTGVELDFCLIAPWGLRNPPFLRTLVLSHGR